MNPESRLARIEEFRRLSAAFDDTLGLDREAVLFRPFDDAWSIVEQVAHCADFDVANFHRYRWGIVSPGTTVLPFDGTWTSVLDYQNDALSSAIGVIKAVRCFMASHLTRIAGSDWSAYAYTFGDGKRMDLEAALEHFIAHVDFHRKLIDRNLGVFSKIQERG